MIKIKVDEAYAFDMLAIATIKAKKVLVEDVYNYFSNLYDTIESSIGYELFDKIYASEEFNLLYKANEEVFDYVEELNKGNTNITGLEVHQANMNRYKYKKELQNKFFGSELLEQKTKF